MRHTEFLGEPVLGRRFDGTLAWEQTRGVLRRVMGQVALHGASIGDRSEEQRFELVELAQSLLPTV